MSNRAICRTVLTGIAMSLLVICGGRAQGSAGSSTTPAPTPSREEQAASAKTDTAPSTSADPAGELQPGASLHYSPGVDEVLQMLHAGVSTDIIKTYIENSPTRYRLTPVEIIAFKKQGVPDELVSAMLKRGAALAAQANQQAQRPVVVVPNSGANRAYGGLDPESYEYFQYYYLYPRTLAAANQRLYTPYPTLQEFGAGPYGFYGAMPFNPLPPSAFSHP